MYAALIDSARDAFSPYRRLFFYRFIRVFEANIDKEGEKSSMESLIV